MTAYSCGGRLYVYQETVLYISYARRTHVGAYFFAKSVLLPLSFSLMTVGTLERITHLVVWLGKETLVSYSENRFINEGTK